MSSHRMDGVFLHGIVVGKTSSRSVIRFDDNFSFLAKDMSIVPLVPVSGVSDDLLTYRETSIRNDGVVLQLSRYLPVRHHGLL